MSARPEIKAGTNEFPDQKQDNPSLPPLLVKGGWGDFYRADLTAVMSAVLITQADTAARRRLRKKVISVWKMKRVMSKDYVIPMGISQRP